MTAPTVLRRALALLVAALVLLTVASPARAQSDEGDAAGERAPTPGRTFVFSIPGVEWRDLREHDLPALESFLGDAAVANLAPRSVVPRSGPGQAYLTISGGSRANSDPSVDGQVLGVDEASAGTRAGDVYERRTGQEATGPYVSLTWPTLLRVNAAEPFDTRLGSLTEALADAGVSTAAIGNADGTDSVGDSYERQVGLAVADPSGVVPSGDLGKDLLAPDPSQAYGVRLDPEAVDEAFALEWDAAAPDDEGAGGVVVVEASDLARTLRYRPTVERGRYERMWRESLGHTDELFAQLIERVDPERDTVLVVAPYNGLRDRDLTVVGLRGPGTGAGLLRSASTQRAGYLTLVDIGPTILDGFGVPRPVAMEGRPAVVVSSSATAEERFARLDTDNAASRFRERLLVPTTSLVVLGFAGVVALAIAAHANRWRASARRAIAVAGTMVLAVLPASYLARAFALEDRGAGFYWTFLLTFALLVPAVAWAVLGRRGRGRGPLVAVLALVAGVLVADVVSGSHLSLSAAFGYSATGNSRLYGISNYSYGQLAAAACLLAAWLAACRAPAPVGRRAAMALLVGVVIVLGVPTWGSDVGGVLAFTPAVAVFWVVVTGRRVRLRTLVAGGAVTGAVIVVFGLLDLSRAPSDRGHLGRLFERIGDEGLGPLTSFIERKLAANLQVSTSSMWVLAIPLAIAFWVFLRRYPDRPDRQLTARFATLPAGIAAAVVAAVLGSILNDSGAIIGGVMCVVVGTGVAVLLLEGGPPAAVDGEQLVAGQGDAADDADGAEAGDEAMRVEPEPSR